MTCIIICFKPRNTGALQPESGKRKLEDEEAAALSAEGAEENGSSEQKKAKRD